MRKVYRPTPRDRLRIWLGGLVPALLGAAFLLGGLAYTAAGIWLVAGGKATWLAGLGAWAFLGLPALVAGWACVYLLAGGLTETLVVDGEGRYFVHRALLFRRRVAVDDIIEVTKTRRGVYLFYRRGGRFGRDQLPAWGGGAYLEEFVRDLRGLRPDIRYAEESPPLSRREHGSERQSPRD